MDPIGRIRMDPTEQTYQVLTAIEQTYRIIAAQHAWASDPRATEIRIGPRVMGALKDAFPPAISTEIRPTSMYGIPIIEIDWYPAGLLVIWDQYENVMKMVMLSGH